MHFTCEMILCVRDADILQTLTELEINDVISSLFVCGCMSNSEHFDRINNILTTQQNIKKICFYRHRDCTDDYCGDVSNIKLLYHSASINDNVTNISDYFYFIKNNKFFGNYLKNTKNLKKLDVGIDKTVKFCQLIANIKNNASLETLIIDGFTFHDVENMLIDELTEQDMDQVVESLRTITTLKKLHLLCPFDDGQMDKIYDYLKTANLECFGLRVDYMSDEKILELANYLPLNPDLTDIEFHGFKCCKKIHCITRSIDNSTLRSLKISDVSGTNITTLTTALKNNNSLDHLKLDRVFIENSAEISKYVLDDSNLSSLSIGLYDQCNVYPMLRIFGKRSTLIKFNLAIRAFVKLDPNLIIMLMEKLKSNTSTTSMKITGTHEPFFIYYNPEKNALRDFLVNNNVVQHFMFHCDGDRHYLSSLKDDPQLQKYHINYRSSSNLLIVDRKDCVINGIKRAITN